MQIKYFINNNNYIKNKINYANINFSLCTLKFVLIQKKTFQIKDTKKLAQMMCFINKSYKYNKIMVIMKMLRSLSSLSKTYSFLAQNI